MPEHRPNTDVCIMAYSFRRLSLRQGLLAVLCFPIVCIFMLGQRLHWLKSFQEPIPNCIGWKATDACLPEGPRQPHLDKTCNVEVGGGSGYCLCEGNVTVARMYCGRHRFRCGDKCMELQMDMSGTKPLPKPLVCGPEDGYNLTRLLPAWAAFKAASGGALQNVADATAVRQGNGFNDLATTFTADFGEPPGGWNASAFSLVNESHPVWDMLDLLVGKHVVGTASIPGPRKGNVDWVMEGRHMKAKEVDKLKAVVAGLLGDLPPFPDEATPAAVAGSKHDALTTVASDAIEDAATAAADAAGGNTTAAAARPSTGVPMFSGRGVVMVGGGLHYLVPAWANLHVLRRTGCTLPVELWFPVKEFPTPAVEAALSELGITSRRLVAHNLAQKGYELKVAALLLSSFREVLFLDSDNAVLRDPTFLFDSEPYLSTGALLWPDYWDRTADPEVADILNIPASGLPAGTFESGEMLIDKTRHWRGLLVAAYLNVYGSVFSELLSCYIGKGDKETFAYGMLSAGERWWLSPKPPGSVGVFGMLCQPSGSAARCQHQFMGNTMLQYGPDGLPLFFHANYHKWDLALPESFDLDWNRRWQVVQPGMRGVSELIYSDNRSGAGYDVERFIFEALRAFRCAPWFDSYQSVRMRMGDDMMTSLEGFHPLPSYITFRDFYSEGWTGSFNNLVNPPFSQGERLRSWYIRKLRWRLRPFGRKLCRWRRRLLPRFLRCRGMK